MAVSKLESEFEKTTEDGWILRMNKINQCITKSKFNITVLSATTSL